MRKLYIAILLAAFLGLTSAEWAEKLRVQAVDNYMNPISGCNVDVAYQKQVSGGLDGKATGKTNEDGVFEVELRNYVGNYGNGENRVYTITVLCPFGFPGETRKVRYGDNPIAGAHLEQFQYNTTSARVKFVVKDQKSKPVPDATVSVNSQVSAVTDENGIAKFGLPLGDYSAGISKYGFSATQLFTLASDMEITVPLLIYENKLKVIATNEYGAPVQGVNLSFNGVEIETNSSGEAEFGGIRLSKGTLVGKFGGIERSVDVEFFEETLTKTLVFPSAPLVIDKISIGIHNKDEPNCTITIGCRARDERVALSKISLTLMYSKDGGQWNSITQKNELGIFEFSVPCSAPLEFSYTLTASNEFGSAQTPIYNTSIAGAVECLVNETAGCITSDNCSGTKTCSGAGKFGECVDLPDDGCPDDGQAPTQPPPPPTCDWPCIKFEGLGFMMIALILVGSLALFGVLGILLITQREKVSGIYEGLKNWVNTVRHVDKVIERADKEYEREKLSQKYMKEGNTDDFFGLDKEDKGGPPGKPPAGPVKP